MRHPSSRAGWLGPLIVLALFGLSASGARAQSAGRTSAPYYSPAPTLSRPAPPPAMNSPAPAAPAATAPAAPRPVRRAIPQRLRPLSDEYGSRQDYSYKS